MFLVFLTLPNLLGTIFRTHAERCLLICSTSYCRVRFFVPVRVVGYGVIVGTSSGGYEFSYLCVRVINLECCWK